VTGDFAVDANAYIAFAAGQPEMLSLIGSAQVVYLPSVVLGELLFGAANSGRAAENRELVLGFAAQCETLDVTPPVAACYASARLALKRRGKPIPENDLWIAATCLAAGIPLLTADAHFSHVEGLELLQRVSQPFS
jgi:tRNA(fMet)-specific endonuclease VapC